jgi:hypothetical protein
MYEIALVKWADHDGLAQAIGNELIDLGHQVTLFRFDEKFPAETDIVLSFAPYGRFFQIPVQLANIPPKERPIFVHWNTENPPDLRIPWLIMRSVSAWRSWLDRLNDSRHHWIRTLAAKPPLFWINKKLYKFRYVGEYHYAYRRGWLDVFAESSEIYAQLHNQHGLPTEVIPWGTVKSWHADLKLERDIEVLWMGSRRTKRRSKLLDQVREQLAAYGIIMYVADNVENPFIYGETRTEFLNRAKITLNLLPTWYDNAFPYRFHIAAGNRSLVVSEPFLAHDPIYAAGKHYVSAPVETIADTILYYLNHEQERLQITENAYQLVTTKRTFNSSIKTLMAAVNKVRTN